MGLAIPYFGLCDDTSRAADTLLPVDVALVFAIDGSGSIKSNEFRFQVAAIVEAIGAPDVMRAIQSERHGRIAVNFVIWGDATLPSQTGKWCIIKTSDDAQVFASALNSLQRQTVGNTGVAAGIGDALIMLDHLPFLADRRVVDVSGDGSETTLVRPRGKTQWRRILSHRMVTDLAQKMGVTINGLALPSDEPELADWYSRNVAVGDDSFVMSVSSFDGVATAMHRKLLREIGPVSTAGLR